MPRLSSLPCSCLAQGSGMRPPMIKLSKLREIDPTLATLSDAELKEVREALYELARLALDVCAGSKSPVGSVHPPDEHRIIRL